MAQNDLKPDHSSSEEEEEDDDDEVTSGSESDEVSDTDSGDKTTQLFQSANKTQPPNPPSSESEESDSGTDSDSDSPPKSSAVVDRSVKPISSVSMQTKSVKGDGSKPVSTPAPAKAKRQAPAAVEKNAKKAKNNTANGKKPVAVPDPDSSEAEESDSGTDSDSDSPPKTSGVAGSSIKPISSKPIERETQTLASKSAKKSPAKSKQPPPTPSPATNEKDVKKGKKSTATDDDTKKQLFQRLWSEDDEIAVLQGMIDFKTERNGENPIADPDAFHDFIRKSLHVDFSRTQLMDKIRRLKKKYVNNATKEKKDGKDRHFAKSHEQKAYELSKLIWDGDVNRNNKSNAKVREVKKNQSQKNGNSKATGTPASTSIVTTTTTGAGAGFDNTAGVVKSNGVDDKDKLKEVELEKKVDILRFVQYGLRNDSSILSEEIVKAGMELVEGSKRAELEEKWKVLMEQELELYVKRMELLKEQALVVLEAVKSSGN